MYAGGRSELDTIEVRTTGAECLLSCVRTPKKSSTMFDWV